MNTVIVICCVSVTLAFIVLVVFAVRTLMQVYKTAQQAEFLLTAVNQEVGILGHICSAIGNFVSQSFPIIKIGSVVSGIVAGWFMKKKRTADSV
jgi:ABC-type uncharacterized transport system permease subunit